MTDPNNQASDGTATFLDHLDTLRWHLIRSLAVILVLAIVAFLNKTFVFDGIVLAPARNTFWTYEALCWLSEQLKLGDNLCIKEMGFKLSNIHMAGQFTQHLFVSFMMGIIIGFPYLIFELWRFIKPALTGSERKYGIFMLFFVFILFALGILFGYYMLSPMSIQFLGSYRVTEDIQNVITLRSFISTLASVVFAAAVIFEIPLVAYILSKLDLITPEILKAYRRHAIIVVLIISAILTPPDFTSQIILCIPFLLLYELSIKISRRIKRQKDRAFEELGD
jgi:sec-independent protein translocase protein TatC